MQTVYIFSNFLISSILFKRLTILNLKQNFSETFTFLVLDNRYHSIPLIRLRKTYITAEEKLEEMNIGNSKEGCFMFVPIYHVFDLPNVEDY